MKRKKTGENEVVGEDDQLGAIKAIAGGSGQKLPGSADRKRGGGGGGELSLIARRRPGLAEVGDRAANGQAGEKTI